MSEFVGNGVDSIGIYMKEYVYICDFYFNWDNGIIELV